MTQKSPKPKTIKHLPTAIWLSTLFLGNFLKKYLKDHYSDFLVSAVVVLISVFISSVTGEQEMELSYWQLFLTCWLGATAGHYIHDQIVNHRNERGEDLREFALRKELEKEGLEVSDMKVTVTDGILEVSVKTPQEKEKVEEILEPKYVRVTAREEIEDAEFEEVTDETPNT